ncbi:MAG: hypothetical protein JETCAE03_36080 [Ignavibacteriaceae bacterium]|jgi:hypothetical protein|nr:MAG: hypothetical protein JETCAE03_36080 [Ignavibacteriaceae bacterium]
MTGLWYLLFSIDLTVTILGIINIIQWDLKDAGVCAILAIILSIILKGYDGYLNTGVWFG